jgi:serine/threonine-protein kinase
MHEPTKPRSVRSSLPAGTRIGRYTIVDRIGAGGMAELFLARQDGPRGFAKPVALKLLHQHVAEDPEFIAMFEREARVAAALLHPNIVQVLDVGFADGEHYLALELIHGRDLRRIITTQRGPLPLGPAVRVVTDVARALDYAHTRHDARGVPLDVVHRDVSPANVLVGFRGAVKLADFGIAKAADQTSNTRTGMLKGKFGYMAPEQYMQQAVDARSDLFALGVVLYEATTGRRAFAGSQTFYVSPTAIDPAYPAPLAELVARLLAVEPAQRPASAREVVEALESIASTLELDTREATLAAYVSGLFDDPPEPSLEVPDVTASIVGSTVAAVGAETVATTRVRSRAPRLVVFGTIGAVGILVGGFGGWRMARGQESVAAIDAAIDAAPPSDDARDTVVEVPRAGAAPLTPAPTATITADAPPTAVASERPSPVPGPSSPAARTIKKPRRRPDAKRSVPERAPADELPAMFPKALQ